MRSLTITYRDQPVYSLSAQQNAYKLFSQLKLSYPQEDDKEAEALPALRNLTVVLHCHNELIATEKWEVAEIRPGQHISLQNRALRFDHEFLLNLTDETSIRFDFEVIEQDRPDTPIFSLTDNLTVLPANFWGGESRQPELLAAFVKPNGPYVESLVKKVTEILELNGHGRSADGYQSNTREKPYFMAAALWGVIGSQRLAYVSPPPSYARQGQLIRLASDISNHGMGACLDLSLLFASCLELMGLNTVIALTEDHAFVGVWLIDTMFPLLTADDAMEIRKRVDAKDLVLFETTMATNAQLPTFKQACDHARMLIDEDAEESFVYALDIAQARSNKIKPLATVEERPDEVIAEQDGAIVLPPAPPLPPVRSDEQVFDETPDTRIETWQRKLLDLTKRNPLLAFKERTTGVRLFCPDPGKLEDHLAEGMTFDFLSSEQSPINQGERSAESFTLFTGNDLHREYALEQLNKRKLIANMPPKKLETTLVNLFRKSKNDLEEGGANTLFIAIGMLAWRELEDQAVPYKAPLILLPVQLTRKSARAPIRLKQLTEEEPLFNLTLIEFLEAEHGINIKQLRENLPEDHSGLDVEKIWQTVKDAVAQQPGFEVKPDCVIASFSFAKYLMWKDLKDRLGDLKKNPFVAHMIDRPQESYQQDFRFLEPTEIDTKIDPSEIFMPLNADSSQIVAIEASGRPQDFVLEGPPGTGKSETIANMIAHNLGVGRKVLFVAEKIAALQVVYRRLEKIGLDHLALELHSNKANKKAVLDQLRRATELRNPSASNSWIHEASRLRARREELNTVVSDLHEPSQFGISPRQAIARVARYGSEAGVDLDWGSGLSDCPVSDQTGVEELHEAAHKAGIAYDDVSDLDPSSFRMINAVAWSYAWQAQVVEVARSLPTLLTDAETSAINLASHFGVDLEDPGISQIRQVAALAELIDIAQAQSIAFALGPDVRERLRRLGDLAEKKIDLDTRLNDIAHGASAPRLTSTPVDEWIQLFEEAKESWFKKLFIRGKLNKLARSLGYEKFDELDILYALRDAKRVVSDVESLSSEFLDYQIWNGWESNATELAEKKASGEQIHELIKQVIGLTDDPMTILTAVKTKLVDGREFLETSKVVGDQIKFQVVKTRLDETVTRMRELDFSIDDSVSLTKNKENALSIIENESKLQLWVDWINAKSSLRKLRLESLSHALESGAIKPSDAKEEIATAFCKWLAPRLIDTRDSLRQFKASEHNQKLKDFRTIDELVASQTGGHIAALQAVNAPNIQSRENSKQFGMLSRELQKKTRHKPIRVLFEDMGERLLDLCPCLMMSPLSVAQFLPADFNAFDLVVFDEASQITTWDAVGAIARGKNVIVVGDPKQMPPTNFFGASVDPDDPDEEDLESILDQAMAAGLPHRRLMGHYRSRHETLIAFSNSKYYENALVTYPSSHTKESAVTLHRVEGIYGKGKGRNNPIEAKEVVKEVVRRLKHPSLADLSLGIVTLNSEQQRTIEDLLDDARRRYPEIEPYFQATDERDPVFVKNLESVQGDERDVIIFSLAYGPTEPGARSMSMNFGPLNKQGGERRLNVAITRATTEVLVFSSFDSSMIDLSRTSALAVEHLKQYLEFAEKGPLALAAQSTADYGVDQFDSDFEQAVAWALRDLGWKVQTQVGVSKFRVDLGVIHPDHPGLFLAGVECDGATYHGSPSARDRDRTRQAVLENLGWRLIRLWSTDFFRDNRAAINKIHQALSDILAEDRAKISDSASTDIPHLDEEIDLDTPVKFAEAVDGGNDEFEYAEIAPGADYPAAIYFDFSHEPVLVQIAREVLSERPGITNKALALEIAGRHGKNKTSQKQLEHLAKLVEPWAGVLRLEGELPVYWPSPADVVDIIPWRGLNAFGYERTWQELAYPEALGLAKEAVKRKPSDPVDYMCSVFELKRRHATTIATFQDWVRAVGLIAS